MKREGTKPKNSPTAAGGGNSYAGAEEQTWQGRRFGMWALVG